MPVEAAFGDPQTPRQRLDRYRGDTLLGDEIQRRLELTSGTCDNIPAPPGDSGDLLVKTELMAQMLLKLAEAYAKDGAEGGIVAMLGEADAAAVKAAFAKEYQSKLAAGIQIESSKEIFKGFRVGAKGGQVFHDFTKEAIADSLANFLRPELAQIVKKAAE